MPASCKIQRDNRLTQFYGISFAAPVASPMDWGSATTARVSPEKRLTGGGYKEPRQALLHLFHLSSTFPCALPARIDESPQQYNEKILTHCKDQKVLSYCLPVVV